MEAIKFLHIRNRDPITGEYQAKGGITVAYLIGPHKYGGTLIRYSVASCSRKDNFVKKYGRDKAAGRLLKDLSCDDCDTFSMTEINPRYHEIEELFRNYFFVGN